MSLTFHHLLLLTVERRRRDNINQVIAELATLIPQCHPGQSKGVVLRKTVEYVKQVQAGLVPVKQESDDSLLSSSLSSYGRPGKRSREDSASSTQQEKQMRLTSSSEGFVSSLVFLLLFCFVLFSSLPVLTWTHHLSSFIFAVLTTKEKTRTRKRMGSELVSPFRETKSAHFLCYFFFCFIFFSSSSLWGQVFSNNSCWLVGWLVVGRSYFEVECFFAFLSSLFELTNDARQPPWLHRKGVWPA